MAKGNIIYRTEEEIEKIRVSSLLVGKTLGELKKHIVPGASTMKLDDIAETFIRDHGAIPAFKNHYPSFARSPFPGSLCISVNEEVVHGMPADNKFLEDGDIVSIDCGVCLNGYYGDSAYTFAVGEIAPKVKKLMEVTKEALLLGISHAVEGKRLGEISHAIQKHVENYGFSIVREMVGHGLGTNLHEPPEVPNFGRRRSGVRLKEGMVLAVEPMVNMGKRFIDTAGDGWTIFATDRNPSAHYEHSIAVGKTEVDILSTFEYIENS